MISVALYILSASALLLLTGARIKFRLLVELRQARLNVEAGIFFGALKLKGDAVACWFPFTLYVNGKLHSLPKRKQKTSLPRHIWNGTEFNRLNISSSVGIKDDGAASVIVSGILREGLRAAAQLLAPHELSVGSTPVFSHNTFWLELEGIARLHPTQIICAVIRQKISKMRKGKEHDASC